MLSRLAREESAQDVVEYALLAAFFGIVGWLTLSGIVSQVFNTYTQWVDPTAGVPSLWDPPVAGGS